MKLRIVVFDPAGGLPDLDLRVEFLPDFPFQGFLWSLARLDLAARELPAVGSFTVAE